MNTVEVCIAPPLFNSFNHKEKAIVIVDVFRATSIICTLFMNGASKVIPVNDINEAIAYKEKGFLVAAERNGKKLDFADFGNSPFEFIPKKIKDKTIVYSTTNGTQTINMCKENEVVLIASFLNLSAIAEYILQLKKDVLILCSGWDGDFCLEDSVFAGALIEKLSVSGVFSLNNDAAISSLDHWILAKPNIEEYLRKSFQYSRLVRLKMIDVIRYCLAFDKTGLIPVFSHNYLILNK